MPQSEARLYFVVTTKGDLGPFSRQELRDQLRCRACSNADRVRNAFGRPLGTVADVLGHSSQQLPSAPATAPVTRQGVPSSRPAWLPIAGIAAVLLAVAGLLALTGNPPPVQTIDPADAASPQPPPAPAPAAHQDQPAQAVPIATTTPAAAPAQPRLAVTAEGMPVGFSFHDLGGSAPPGSVAASDKGIIVLSAGGEDIWGQRDQCGFLHRRIDSDCVLSVVIRSKDDTDPWDKAGLMLRASTKADAAQASVLALHSGAVQFAWRPQPNQDARACLAELGSLPLTLRLERRGNTFTGSASRDGIAWTTIGCAEIPAIPAAAEGGLANSSHNRAVTNRAVFADLGIVSAAGR